MLEKKIKGYQKRFKKYGVDLRAVQFASKKAQDIRFNELVSDLKFTNKTILDVGCGFADIIPYIEKKIKNLAPHKAGAGFEFTGVDLVSEFIEVCKQKYPKHTFIVRDYFGKPLEKNSTLFLVLER